MKECKNKECVKHTPVVHLPGCKSGGSNACTDMVHNRTCWTQDELDRVSKQLEVIIEENETTI